MSLHASCSNVCTRLTGSVLGALLFAVPLVAASGAEAQGMRQPAPQIQRAPAAPQMERQPAAPQVQRQRAPMQGHTANAADFRGVLQPYGRWQHHSRWGDVWAPPNRARNWRPYTVGRWAFTDDWGWYWISDAAEASWGWVTYHYGRWVFDADLGWIWVPGTEWSPGWVQWRHGGQYVGWAPLPPDEIAVEFRDQPDVWIFVRENDFVFAPNFASVILPAREIPVLLGETAVVNTAVPVGGGFAVNPGISPAFVASAIGRPVPTYSVRPRVLAGTAQVPGAMQVRPQDLRSAALRRPVTAQRTQNVIRPSANAPKPQALAPGERGRLGSNPPRMARGAAPSTTGQAPGQRQQLQQQQQGQRQVPPAHQQRQQGAQQQPSSQPSQQQSRQAQPQQHGRARPEPQTQGRGAVERHQQQRAAQPPQRPSTEGRATQPHRQPQAERHAIEQQRRERALHGRGAAAAQQARPQRPQPSPPHVTEGRGPGARAPQAAAPRPQPRAPSPATVGRGGGGPVQAAPQHGPVGGAPRSGPPAAASPGGGGHGGPHGVGRP